MSNTETGKLRKLPPKKSETISLKVYDPKWNQENLVIPKREDTRDEKRRDYDPELNFSIEAEKLEDAFNDLQEDGKSLESSCTLFGPKPCEFEGKQTDLEPRKFSIVRASVKSWDNPILHRWRIVLIFPKKEPKVLIDCGAKEKTDGFQRQELIRISQENPNKKIGLEWFHPKDLIWTRYRVFGTTGWLKYLVEIEGLPIEINISKKK